MLNITLITNGTLLGDCTVVCQLNLLTYVTKKNQLFNILEQGIM